MAIDKKAQAYDEAVERALKLEDERIREALIDFFSISAENGEQTNGVYDKDILSWLEKQSYTKKDIDDAYLKGVTDTKNEIEKQYEANYQIRKDIATFIFNYRGDIKDRAKWMDYLGIRVSFAEKQGEQKSTCKEEDEKMLWAIPLIIKSYPNQEIFYGYSKEKLISWFKTLKQRIGG